MNKFLKKITSWFFRLLFLYIQHCVYNTIRRTLNSTNDKYFIVTTIAGLRSTTLTDSTSLTWQHYEYNKIDHFGTCNLSDNRDCKTLIWNMKIRLNRMLLTKVIIRRTAQRYSGGCTEYWCNVYSVTNCSVFETTANNFTVHYIFIS